MKVLIIMTDRFPKSGACTNLLVKLIGEGGLGRETDEIHVCVPKYALSEEDHAKTHGITLHRMLLPAFLPAAELRKNVGLRILLRAVVGKLWDHKVAPCLFKKEFILPFMSRELFRAVCRLCEKEKFDLLVPIVGAHEVANAAMRINRELGIPMVLYQVDPCSTNVSFSQKSAKKRIHFEKALYEAADAVITTPIIFRENCRRDDLRMAHVLPMEFPAISKKTVPCLCERKNTEVVCVFAGRVYPGIRNPRYTLGLFESMNKDSASFHMYGVSESDLTAFGIGGGSSAVCHGVCDLQQVQDAVSEADVLVNIGNCMKNQVPSKVFEYISACKPIVNICANSDCPTIPYLSRYPLAMTVVEGDGTAAEHAEKMEQFILKNAGKTVDKDRILEIFKECTAEYCAGIIREVMRKVTEDATTTGAGDS